MEASKSEKKKEKVKKAKPRKFRQVGATRESIAFWSKWLPAMQKAIVDQKVRHQLSGSKEPFKVKRGDIPWFDAVFAKGTQIPPVRLYYIEAPIGVAASTEKLDAVPITFDAFYGFVDLQTLFDEYRALHGIVEYYPNQYIGSTGYYQTQAVGTVDYSDSSAPANRDTVLQYDNRKIFNIVSISGIQKPVRWPVLLDWTPDTEWVSTSVANVEFASWKLELPANHGLATGVVGNLEGWMDFQFRLQK